MAEPSASTPPPPYTPPSYPEAEPPPYSPADDNNKPPDGATHTQYGTGGPLPTDTPPKYEAYPPAAPAYGPTVPPSPLSSSTTLLVAREHKPPSFFLLSIMTCLCFSPLFGLVAIVFSCLSDSAWAAGDTQSARRYSQVAITLSVVGILTSVLTVVLIFVTGAVRVHY